jgi:hypothetical protein
MKTVIVGMNDPTFSDPSQALSTLYPRSSGRRLWLMSGMTAEEWEAAFERVNLVQSLEWSMTKAKLHASVLKENLKGRRVLVLGKQTWMALGGSQRDPFFKTVDNWTLLPHTSGKNLYYNSAPNRRKLKHVLRKAAKSSGEVEGLGQAPRPEKQSLRRRLQACRPILRRHVSEGSDA